EIHVEPKPTVVKRPLGLIVTTRESPPSHLPSLVTSFVVLSLRFAMPVNCEVSPILVSARLPPIEMLVTVGEGSAWVSARWATASARHSHNLSSM
ncbi:MAG: hypothetical protein LC753_09510, partial [Acidobacteria bacterium]|nr:hypothetical protein [Acidobacteriota bacterium]